MLISSDFHDYYDCIQRDGVDKRLVYNRKAKTIKENNSRSFPYVSFGNCYIIGFCGKLYPLVRTGFGNNQNSLYSFEECEPFLKKSIKKYTRSWFTNQSLKKFFETIYPAEDYFEKYRVPIFLVKPKRIRLNPRLSEFQFQKIFDPYSAYQELSMFMGSILCENEDKIPIVDDKTLAQAKGFDKYSFRKPK